MFKKYVSFRLFSYVFPPIKNRGVKLKSIIDFWNISIQSVNDRLATRFMKQYYRQLFNRQKRCFWIDSTFCLLSYIFPFYVVCDAMHSCTSITHTLRWKEDAICPMVPGMLVDKSLSFRRLAVFFLITSLSTIQH